MVKLMKNILHELKLVKIDYMSSSWEKMFVDIYITLFVHKKIMCQTE
jgi:hypothetical protein